MNKIKVLGIGSPFGDDKLGWSVIERLRQRHIIQVDELHAVDRPGVRLLALMEGASTVYLIDAVVTGRAVGTIVRLQNEEIDELNSVLSTHDIGVAATLQLGRALDRLPLNIILYGIEIEDYSSNANVSLKIEAAIDQLVLCIEREIS